MVFRKLLNLPVTRFHLKKMVIKRERLMQISLCRLQIILALAHFYVIFMVIMILMGVDTKIILPIILRLSILMEV
ncbi:hypothetical protein D3C86_1245200 [compost metagenome]